jgi:PAS domain S-box-containing protein
MSDIKHPRKHVDDWQHLPISPARLLESVADAVVVTDPIGLILFWNAAAESTYGWPADEVLGRSIHAIAPAHQTALEAAAIISHLQARQHWTGDVLIRRRDGTDLPVRFTNTPVSDDAGQLLGIISTAVDLSDVHEAVRKLAASERRVKALLHNAGELFAITDVDGVITFVEGPVEAYLGPIAGPVIGSSVFSLVPPGGLARAKDLWAKRLTTAGVMPAEEFWIQRRDGTWLCLSLVVNNLLEDPDIAGIVFSAHDVTALKRLEQARQAVSGANSALVRAVSETDLFSEICEVVVSGATYRLAWVGLSDPASPLGVRMVASANRSIAYVEAIDLLATSGPYGSPLSIAMETRKLQIVQDVAALPSDIPWRQFAIESGFRSMIALPLPISGDEFGLLAIYAAEPNVFSEEAVDVLSELAADISFGVDALRTRVERTSYRTRFEASLEAAVRAIATAAELRDPYTGGHQRRVAELSAAISQELGLPASDTNGIAVAASIHDIGKLAVPAEILSRPGRLSEAEFAIVKEHAQAGHDIVAGIDFPWPVAEMIRQHHERQDGSGYPQGLRGDKILLGSRILAIADIVEAMHSHRPYRPALGIDSALAVIGNERGTRLDADAVDACIALFRERGFQFMT